MDPTATLRLLVNALTMGDIDAAREHFADLDAWLSRGGFPPQPQPQPTHGCARCGFSHEPEHGHPVPRSLYNA